MARSQSDCVMAVNTSLGDDTMLLRSLRGCEGMSELFSYHLVMESLDHDIDHDDIMGTNATARLELPNSKTRYWNGQIRRFRQAGVSTNGLAVYHAEMVPIQWFLTRSSDCRIFQRKSVPDILEQVFQDFGIQAYTLELTDNYPELEYCVQYRETAFNFISRLLEDVGIFYYFAHSNGKHTMVIADSHGRLDPWPDYAEIPFWGPGRSTSPGESLSGWTLDSSIVSDAVARNDYNFKTPATSLLTKASAGNQSGHPVYEVYDYPGGYPDVDAGNRQSRVRHEENQWQHQVYRGETNARGVAPGYLLKVKGHPHTSASTEFVVVHAETTIESSETGALHHGDDHYACTFEAIDTAKPFRPPRRAARSLVEGPQTAVVVGPAGEEIHCDEYGRVKVQFHWDREGRADENSSCWIRVAQLWAGKKWGAIYTPRIGQEVVVEFLEGDPDRPMVTGRVYHAANMPPYTLPDEKTKSTLKSNSSKDGGGFNELRFEDKAGEEQIFIHGQKDEDIRILNDAREWIGNDRHLIVKNDQFELVEGSKHRKINVDRTSEIGGDDLITIIGNRMEDVAQQSHLAIGADHTEKVGGDYDLGIAGDRKEEIGGNQSLTVSGDQDESVTNHALDAGMNIHLKAGMNVVIEAGLTITLKAGGGFIVVGPAGVDIFGMPVNINSGGSAGVGSGASPKEPGSPSEPGLPTEPQEADGAQTGDVTSAQDRSQQRPAGQTGPGVHVSPRASVLRDGAESGRPFCEECERARQEQAQSGQTQGGQTQSEQTQQPQQHQLAAPGAQTTTD